MKKNLYRSGGGMPTLKKLTLMMKLNFFLMLVAVLQVSASQLSAQKTHLDLKMKDASLAKILDAIEEQSEVYFFYDKSQIDENQKVDIDFHDLTVEEALNHLRDALPITYEIVGKNIIIKPLDYGQAIVQQPHAVSGKVTDPSGIELPGVTVVVKRTTLGTTTGADGKYSLANVPSDAILVFSFVGMKTQEIPVAGKTGINVTMLEDAIGIEEVVAVGYGVQKKVNLTGAVSSVNFEKDVLTSRSITNISSAMAGMTSGVRTRQENGLPRDNNEASIRIRGVGSLNLSSEPLVLVDGSVANFNSVNPNDVASISVLKDAASAAIYGARASNGVILITTKTGSNTGGKITFNYSSYIGKKSPTLLTDIVSNTADHMTLINWAQINSGINDIYSQEQIDEWREKSKTDPIGYPNTNWWNALIKDNVVMNHNLSARGGNEKINFYTSFDYYDDDGMIANTAFRKLNFRNNLGYQVNKWLKLGNNLSILSMNSDPVDIGDIFQWFRATSPGTVAKHPDGRYGAAQTPKLETGNNNPVRSAEAARGEIENNQVQGKIYGVFTPLNGLSVTASYFANLIQQFSWRGNEIYDLWNFQTNEIANVNTGTRNLTNNSTKNITQVIDLYADYGRVIGNHDFKVLLGYNQESYFSRSFGGTRQNILSYDTPVLDAASGEITDLSGNNNDYAMRSFFGRLNYNYGGKYLFEANMRYDGSSRFAPNERWGIFPSVSVGWIISEEKFFSPIRNSVNSLKLRASYGVLGNNGIGNYEWQNFYQSANYVLGNEMITPGLAYTQFGNSIITWESTNVLNAGVDIQLFNDLRLDLNYYNKLTDNILARLPIPGSNGGITAPRENAAKVRNSGIELEARYQKKIGRVDFNAGFNLGYNKNKIEKYRGDFIQVQNSNIGNSWTEGHPIGIWWIREVDHIVQQQSEIDALVADGYTFAPGTPGPGDFLYKNNDNDKAIGDGDRVLKGNPIPLFTYGGNIGISYGGFDFNVYVDGVGKWDKYLQSAVFSLNHTAGGYLWPKEYLKQWREDNPSTKIPKVYSNNTKNSVTSDFFLYKADYFKIRSIQLGYSLPASLLHSIKIEKLRFFINLENYFTFTDYPAMDPEADRTTDDDVTYPLSKTASVGLNISF